MAEPGTTEAQENDMPPWLREKEEKPQQAEERMPDWLAEKPNSPVALTHQPKDTKDRGPMGAAVREIEKRRQAALASRALEKPDEIIDQTPRSRKGAILPSDMGGALQGVPESRAQAKERKEADDAHSQKIQERKGVIDAATQSLIDSKQQQAAQRTGNKEGATKTRGFLEKLADKIKNL